MAKKIQDAEAEEVNKRLIEIEKDYRSRDYDALLDKANAFKTQHPDYKLSIIGCLIDVGSIKYRKDLIEEAIEIFESHNNERLPEYLNYNAANGYLALFHIMLQEGEGYFKSGEYAIKAIELFRNAGNEPNTLTNYGNALDEIGRPIEAIGAYDRALMVDGDFGMALGNKAQAISKIAVISQFQGSYLIYAYQHFKRALDNEDSIKSFADESVLVRFKNDMAYIESLFKDNPEKLEGSLKHPSLKLKETKFVEYYTSFCLDNDLYINLHFFSNVTEESVGDTLGLNFVSKILNNNNELNDLVFRLNEIKEAYIGARLSLVQSQYVNKDFSNISKQTLIINPLDYSVSNIYTSYVKMAFKEAFSVLDKIAIFLNRYLDLGYAEDNKRLSYHTIWYKSLNKDNGINDTLDSNDHNLYGLYSLLREIRSSEYDDIRNALTHRYVRLFRHMNVDGEYEYEEFVEKTVELMRHIKYAIIYLHNYINTSEQSKKTPEDKLITMHFNSDQWLDIWE